ncbi:hypothetical protein ALC57_10791 [Trachymyrmex cornetzi]|uniref:Uncharacterized protein n=1 Tax=Trachymyrmex cornetzi TaxID=471704 RepID=A0A151J398_9HYME|nr:hypothetical protein ALC57_10791 [Trachymyrmex cornetzi]
MPNAPRSRGIMAIARRRESDRNGARKKEKQSGEARVAQEDEGGTKYRRRTAVGIKRGDGRRATTRRSDGFPSCPPISAYLTSSPTRVLHARAGALVAPDDAATRHAARPRTMLYRIILAGPLWLRPYHNGT